MPLENNAALSAPLRNCDVGTAEEQSIRFGDFCNARKPQECRNCPCYQPVEADCPLIWAQMPYEKKEEVNDRVH